MAKGLVRQSTTVVRSQTFNLDNGAGTTVDEALFSTPSGRPARLVRVNAIYQEATGTVAAANFKVGASAGGADYVAATAYEDSKAVGVVTEAALVTDIIPASSVVFARHTGIASTATGTATICVEFAFDE